MDRRHFLLTAALAALSLPPIPAEAAEKLTVLLDWYVNPDHAPLVLARERGHFAAAGLDVDLVPPADPSAPPRLVAAGQADLAVTYQPNFQMQVAEGLPLVRIATLVATPLNCLMTLGGGPIRTLADLKGRKVGFSVGGFEDALLGGMLKTVGLGRGDVELVNINFALSSSLLAGTVDAVIGAFRNFERHEIEKAGKVPQAFYPEEHGVPPYDELIVVCHRDRIADNRLRRFVDAVERGVLALANDPAGAWKAFVSAYPKLDDPLNRSAWAATLPRFAASPAALDRGRYERMAAFLREQGVLSAALPPVADYAVDLPL